MRGSILAWTRSFVLEFEATWALFVLSVSSNLPIIWPVESSGFSGYDVSCTVRISTACHQVPTLYFYVRESNKHIFTMDIQIIIIHILILNPNANYIPAARIQNTNGVSVIRHVWSVINQTSNNDTKKVKKKKIKFISHVSSSVIFCTSKIHHQKSSVASRHIVLVMTHDDPQKLIYTPILYTQYYLVGPHYSAPPWK